MGHPLPLMQLIVEKDVGSSTRVFFSTEEDYMSRFDQMKVCEWKCLWLPIWTPIIQCKKGWSGGTMEFEPQAKTNLVGGQKCATWGVRVESLVMSIWKCPDLVSKQRGWPKVITWHWLWVGHLSCNDFHFLGMGFWGASMLCFQHDNL